MKVKPRFRSKLAQIDEDDHESNITLSVEADSEEYELGIKNDEDETSILTRILVQLRQWSLILKIIIMVMICTVSVGVRVFSVINYESVIHEYDPWFNFRSTRYMLE